MAIPSIRWLRRIASAIIVITALVLSLVLVVALPEATTALVTNILKLIPPLSLPLVIVLIAQATLLLVAAIWWLWWRLPRRQVHRLDIQIHDPKARADTEDNFRKTVGQALGGVAVLIGAVAAYLQFTQQQQASHDLLISNQVSKGFEQLAGDKMAMRLGGIYALEGVMNTSSEYHDPVLEALCAFVRESTAGKVEDRPVTEVQAVLTVIRRRKAGPGNVNLSGARIPGADLNGADLSDANLSGANLSTTRLANAKLTHADLTGADLHGANLGDAELRDADLNHANLSGANLSGADLPSIRHYDTYVEVTVRRGVGGADLTGADLRDADLTHANLIGANLQDAYLTGADLTDAKLRDADLTRATLHGARLKDTDLTGADLSYTSFADLEGSKLSDANLPDFKFNDLTQAELDQACGKPKALPKGLTLDKPCPPHPSH